MLAHPAPATGCCTLRSDACDALREDVRGELYAPARGFNSCAVVASSGTLLRDRLGENIDHHDAVFRFNNAPVLGFEPVVGHKTT
eukprot:1908604-Prymnesium_polylepis.1